MEPTQTQKNKVAEITTIFTDLYSRFSSLRAAQIKNYRYAAGKMLDDDILAELKKQKRPTLIFRLLHKQLLFMSGIIAEERKRMRAVPMRIGDEDLSDLHTVLTSDWAMNSCNGYTEYGRAAMDAVIARIGWVNHYWSLREDPEGRPVVTSEDPLAFVWDLDARRTDQLDWRYLAKHGLYNCEEIIGIYAKYLDEDTKRLMRERDAMLRGAAVQTIGKPVGAWNRLLTGFERLFRGTESSPAKGELLNDLLDAQNGMYRVIEWHDRRTTVSRFAYSPLTGSQELLDPALADNPEYEASILARHTEGRVMTMESESLWITPVVPALLESKVLFEQPYQIQDRGYQYKPVFCYDFTRDLTETTSLVDILSTPNDFHNQRMMTMLELGMDIVNPSYDYPEGSITPAQRAAWESKERGILREWTQVVGSDTGPKPRVVGTDGFQVMKVLAEEGTRMVQDLSGFTPNLQGFAETSNEPASLYQQRVQQGMVMLASFFANLHGMMKGSFAYVDAMLQAYMTFERMIRLLEEPPKGMPGVIQQGKAYWIAVNQETLMGVKNDLSQGKYDFVPDTDSIGKTQKQQKFLETLELIKVMPPELILWPKLFELHDSPVAADMKAFVEMKMGMMVQQEAQARELADANAKVDLTNKALGPAQPAAQAA